MSLVNCSYSNAVVGASASWGGQYISVSQVGTLELGEIRLYVEEESVVPTVRQLYSALKALKEEDVSNLLKKYIKTSREIDAVRELLDLRRLASLILWLTGTLKLEVSSVDLVEDLETGQPMFLGVYIKGCGWDEWKAISRSVKERLVSEGFSDVAGRVALVCEEALMTQRG